MNHKHQNLYQIDRDSKNLKNEFTANKTFDKNSMMTKCNRNSKVIAMKNKFIKSLGKPLPQWNMSSSTLRNSSIISKFPQDQRFKVLSSNYYNIFHNSSSELSKRATSFGVGQKSSIPITFQNGANQTGLLCINSDNEYLKKQKKIGKTFGLAWKNYQASLAPHRKTIHSQHQLRSNPGPGNYNISLKTGDQAKKVKIHQKLQMFSEIRANYLKTLPGPFHYIIEQKNIIKKIKGGKQDQASRFDFTKNSTHTPGPIYTLPNFSEHLINKKSNLSRAQR